LVLAAVVVLLLLAPYVAQRIAFAIARGEELARAEVARKELEGLPAAANRYALVAKIIEPSVVGIQTTIRVASPFGESGLFEPEVRAMAQGSGVIVDPSGYILTNAHVISQAAQGGVTVQLSDGRTVEHATIVGVDPATDLAVLKIDAGSLSAAKWGDSDALQVGDPVLAVGSPYGLAETVTAGIISAKNRTVGIEHVGYEDFLQIDAAVNPGNSGGPLVNMNAHVVGINTAIVGRAYQGISFAIPSGLARKVYELLRTSGISRGWIGVAVQDLSKSLAEHFGLKEMRGALVAQVMSGSPAEKAGLRTGDVIVEWDKQPVTNSNDLRIEVARTRPGSTVQVAFYRDGKRRALAVTVAERPSKAIQ
jgi:serine protease Do